LKQNQGEALIHSSETFVKDAEEKLTEEERLLLKTPLNHLKMLLMEMI
jgi:hypothetical protein